MRRTNRDALVDGALQSEHRTTHVAYGGEPPHQRRLGLSCSQQIEVAGIGGHEDRRRHRRMNMCQCASIRPGITRARWHRSRERRQPASVTPGLLDAPETQAPTARRSCHRRCGHSEKASPRRLREQQAPRAPSPAPHIAPGPAGKVEQKRRQRVGHSMRRKSQAIVKAMTTRKALSHHMLPRKPSHTPLRVSGLFLPRAPASPYRRRKRRKWQEVAIAAGITSSICFIIAFRADVRPSGGTQKATPSAAFCREEVRNTWRLICRRQAASVASGCGRRSP